jgi:hypothetical protein
MRPGSMTWVLCLSIKAGSPSLVATPGVLRINTDGTLSIYRDGTAAAALDGAGLYFGIANVSCASYLI